jgi:hypothetical protein
MAHGESGVLQQSPLVDMQERLNSSAAFSISFRIKSALVRNRLAKARKPNTLDSFEGDDGFEPPVLQHVNRCGIILDAEDFRTITHDATGSVLWREVCHDFRPFTGLTFDDYSPPVRFYNELNETESQAGSLTWVAKGIRRLLVTERTVNF